MHHLFRLCFCVCERSSAAGTRVCTRRRGALFRVNIYRENTMHIKVLRGFVHLEGFCGSNSACYMQQRNLRSSVYSYNSAASFSASHLSAGSKIFREPKPILWTSLYGVAAQFLIESVRCSCTQRNFSWKRLVHALTFSQSIMPRKWMGKSTRLFLSARSHKIFRLTKLEPPFVLMSGFLSLSLCVLYI